MIGYWFLRRAEALDEEAAAVPRYKPSLDASRDARVQGAAAQRQTLTAIARALRKVAE